MKKSRSIALLSILSIFLIVTLVFTFIKFPIGIKNYNSIFGTIEYDHDVVGGAAFTLSLKEDDDVESLNDVISTIKSRLNMLGHTTAYVQALKDVDPDVKDSDIRIITRNTSSVLDDIEAVIAYGTLEFFGGTSENPTTQIMTEEETVQNCYYMSAEGKHYCVIELTDYGYEALKEAVSAEESSYYLRIALGDEGSIFSGVIQSVEDISKTLYPSYNTKDAAMRAVLQVKTGGLAYRYEITAEGGISAALGENTITYSFIAIAFILFVAIVGLTVLYRGFGLIGGLTLLSFILAEIAMMIAVPGIVVSIGGIIGILLSTILAVDGLVITAKRINEEYQSGKTVKAAVKAGFRRSFKSILHVSVLAGIVALLLFIFTGGVINGFAITFGIGVILSFLSNVLISLMFTNLILSLVGDKGDKFLNLKREGE